MSRRIAVFGGSFNPPHVQHRVIAEQLCSQFDEVIIVPCGPRPDKPVTNDVEAVHRAAMTDLNFRGMDRVRVELFDLEKATFTRTHELEKRFAAEGEVWHVVGTDLIRGGGSGESLIHRAWQQGPELWHRLRFAVSLRPGCEVPHNDLPPNSRYFAFDGQKPLSSSEVRMRIFQRHDFEGMMEPAVASYVERHGLYRGGPAYRKCAHRLEKPRFDIVHDVRNPHAIELAARLERFRSTDPELIVVIGGDGTMLSAVRQHWRRRLPFYGVNTGHLGFLLNEVPPDERIDQELVLHQLPQLFVEVEDLSGNCNSELAFNDTWVERATGQTAWIEVQVDGHCRIPQLVADGALVVTANGSTCYARAMGGPPLPLDTPALVLVGSNVLRPPHWRPAVLPLSSRITLTTLDPKKRPLQAYVDGEPFGLVRQLRARVSYVAAAQLIFAPPHDLSAKVAALQFPPGL